MSRGECCNEHLAGCSVHLVQRCLQEMQPRILLLFSFFVSKFAVWKIVWKPVVREESAGAVRPGIWGCPMLRVWERHRGFTSTGDGIGGTGCLALAFFALLFLFTSLNIPTRMTPAIKRNFKKSSIVLHI